ncbi:rolling circle replication-associated protein [Roseateles sp. PN1]|uniref:rolling circle replication-associated protein n=1 Tax=Roseateles sp. PN1 TaxID=3137372 RepID=UPI003139B09A
MTLTAIQRDQALILREIHDEAIRAAGPDEGAPFDHWAQASALSRVRRKVAAQSARYETPVRGRQRKAAELADFLHDAPTGAGLVSVPTKVFERQKTVLEALGGVAAARDEACEALDVFTIDKAKRRLALLRRSVGFAARAHAVSEKGSRTDRAWMVTLTYKPGQSWQSNHLTEAMRAMRLWCAKKGIAWRYVWVAEIQDGKRRTDGKGRDVIHYHAVIWLPVGVRCPHFDKRGWWPFGMSQSLEAKNAVGYLLHYLKKDKDLSAMPKGARAYGVGGLDHSLRRARRWLGLPSFVQANSDIGDEWKRAAGGGWLCPDGVLYPSEFERVKVGGLDALRRIHRHERVIEAGGPFSWLSRSPVH